MLGWLFCFLLCFCRVIKLWEILRRSIRINFVAVLLFCKFLEGLAVCWFFSLLLLFSGVLLVLFVAFCFAVTAAASFDNAVCFC